jgi:chromosome segregation ATPase
MKPLLRFSIQVCTGLLGLISAVSAQTAPADRQVTDRQINEQLLAEVRQLRQTLERVTLVIPRMLLTVQRVQFQQDRVTRLSEQVDAARRDLANAQQGQRFVADRTKYLENTLSGSPDAQTRRQSELELGQLKAQLEHNNAFEQQQRTRESDLSGQLQAEKGRLNELNDQLNQMDRAIDSYQTNAPSVSRKAPE